LDASADGEGSHTLPPVAALAGKPSGAFFEDVAHPVQRLHIVLERGPAEQADLRDVGRAQTWLAALALYGFDHRRLFAANVGAGASSKMDRRNRIGRIRLKRRDLTFENRPAAVILVAQVNVNRFDSDCPGCD